MTQSSACEALEVLACRQLQEIRRTTLQAWALNLCCRTRLARSTVSDYAGRAVAAGLIWPLPEGLTDTALEALLLVRGARRCAGRA